MLLMLVLAWPRHRPSPAPSSIDGWCRVSWELERARRHGRPLVLVRLPLSRPGDARQEQRLVSDVSPLVRSTDAAWIDGDDLCLVLPEVTRLQAQPCLRRIYGRLGGRARPAAATLAAFPGDGITLGALQEALRSRAPSPADAERVIPPPARDGELLPEGVRWAAR